MRAVATLVALGCGLGGCTEMAGADGDAGPCAVCLPAEACVSTGREVSCEALCTPPRLLRFVELPVGVVLPLEPGVEVLDPSTDGDWQRQTELRLDRLGTIDVEARWLTPPEPCEDNPVALARYQVVEELPSAEDAPTARDAVAADDPRISAWASGWVTPASFGRDLDPVWEDVEPALGPATGAWYDAVSLGNGGALTFTFDEPFGDGPGPDLAVFENGFSADFLELAWVEVSSDGINFARFSSLSFQTEAVGPYGALDASEVTGVAGRYAGGYGTGFDLAHLIGVETVATGRVDLDAVRFVRIVDIVGDGSARDSAGGVIYDPTPTHGPAGFDVEAIAILGGGGR